MRHVCALTVASLLVASASNFAQDGGPGQVPRPVAPAARPLVRGSVSGHVFLADTHSPARGARVMLLPAAEFGVGDKETPSNTNGDQQLATTALDGSFVLSHVGSGQYIVLAFAAGYLSAIDGIEIDQGNNQADMKAIGKKLLENAPVVRVTGSESARIDIDLQRGAVVAGRVLYSDGAPAAQLSITVQKAGESMPSANPTMDVGSLMRTLFLQQRLSTDDQGHFRIAGIPPGTYCVAVAQNFASGTDFSEVMMPEFNPMANQSGRLTIYSGNTLHRKNAKMYELKAGDTVDGIEITLPLNGLHTIHGSVAGKDGAMLNSGSLDLADTSDSTIRFHASVEADGGFRFSGVPEGTYSLKASNGRIFENPPAANIPAEYVQNDPQYRAVRAFADTMVPVAVQTTDIDGLTVTLPDTKLPDLPKPQQFPVLGQPGVPDQSGFEPQ